MKTIIKSTTILLLSVLLMTSCRTEETENIQPPVDETLDANSLVADLMLRTATNDGSNDNIIDNSNCFNVQLPITVIVNGIEFIVNTEDDFEDIEDIFDEFEEDSDEIQIVFPIIVILSDFSEVTINNLAEFNTLSSSCNGENEYDDDIECIDFQYPLTVSIYIPDNDFVDVITISNDNDLYDFIESLESLDSNAIITIDFPIIVVLSDGSQITINNLEELATVIENAEDDCDEDDDYDYNDDDCDDCTPSEIIALLTGCSDWEVDKLENDNNDFDDLYDGYLFNFFNDGTLSVFWNTTTVYGTWSAEGTGNDIIVNIDIPSLLYCNNAWSLHEIDQGVNETKIDLRVGDEDRLRYENDNCN